MYRNNSNSNLNETLETENSEVITQNKTQRLDYIQRIIQQSSKDYEIMKSNMFANKRFSE